MIYIARITALTVVPADWEPIFSELATRIEIADEADGEFVTVTQSGRVVRSAITKMIAECKKMESK